MRIIFSFLALGVVCLAAPAPGVAAPAGGTSAAGAAHAAFVARERACGKLWRADKAAGRTAGQSWPKYLSACNARLKAKGG